jgi:hypothetical protein
LFFFVKDDHKKIDDWRLMTADLQYAMGNNHLCIIVARNIIKTILRARNFPSVVAIDKYMFYDMFFLGVFGSIT